MLLSVMYMYIVYEHGEMPNSLISKLSGISLVVPGLQLIREDSVIHGQDCALISGKQSLVVCPGIVWLG